MGLPQGKEVEFGSRFFKSSLCFSLRAREGEGRDSHLECNPDCLRQSKLQTGWKGSVLSREPGQLLVTVSPGGDASHSGTGQRAATQGKSSSLKLCCPS